MTLPLAWSVRPPVKQRDQEEHGCSSRTRVADARHGVRGGAGPLRAGRRLRHLRAGPPRGAGDELLAAGRRPDRHHGNGYGLTSRTRAAERAGRAGRGRAGRRPRPRACAPGRGGRRSASWSAARVPTAWPTRRRSACPPARPGTPDDGPHLGAAGPRADRARRSGRRSTSWPATPGDRAATPATRPGAAGDERPRRRVSTTSVRSVHGMLEILQRHTNGLRFRALDARSPEIDPAGLDPAGEVAALAARFAAEGVEPVLQARGDGLRRLLDLRHGRRRATTPSPVRLTACGEAADPSVDRSLLKALLEHANSRARKAFCFGDRAAARAVADPDYWAAVERGGAAGEPRAVAAMRAWHDLGADRLRALTAPDRSRTVDVASTSRSRPPRPTTARSPGCSRPLAGARRARGDDARRRGPGRQGPRRRPRGRDAVLRADRRARRRRPAQRPTSTWSVDRRRTDRDAPRPGGAHRRTRRNVSAGPSGTPTRPPSASSATATRSTANRRATSSRSERERVDLCTDVGAQVDACPAAAQSKIGSTVRRALELEEALVRRQREHAVVHPAGLLALRRGRHDGTEERDVADVDDRGADVLAHRVHARVVRRAQRVVVVADVAGVRQLGRQADVTQRALEGVAAEALLAGVDPRADRGVEGAQLLLAVAAPRRRARRGPGPSPCRASRGSRRRCRGPLFSTDRLITWKTVLTGRTFSTSSIQRDVIHAQGQIGSNQKSTVCVAVGLSAVSPARAARPAPRSRGPRAQLLGHLPHLGQHRLDRLAGLLAQGLELLRRPACSVVACLFFFAMVEA